MSGKWRRKQGGIGSCPAIYHAPAACAIARSFRKRPIRGAGRNHFALAVLWRTIARMHPLFIRPFLPLGILFCASPAVGAPSSPLAPDAQRLAFECEPGLEVRLAASEPIVESPCALAFDAKGRLFVAENRGYPSQAQPPLGRIALLEDTDGDGVFEKRTTFADNLTFPNGLLPFDGGLLVTCAPDVILFHDRDGDGVAEQKKLVLTGFATSGSTQLRVNDPTLLPDGWIHFAGGLSGGKVRAVDHPELPEADLAKGDLRYDPRTGRCEVIDGKSQFGHEFDRAGARFLCMNRVQVQHVPVEGRWLTRNPLLTFSESVHDCPENPDPFGLRGEKPAARIHPISDNITTADRHAGTFSAACGILLWHGGGALPDAFAGRMLSCDPTANLVHWDDLLPSGATWTARRSPDKTEMLRSSDNWFRPVFLARGPDGALYIADMYRRTIEHPDYLPEGVRKHTDFDSGRTMGRIWRVSAREKKSTASGSDAESARLQALAFGPFANADAELALLRELSGSPHAWARERAARRAAECLKRIPQAVDCILPLARDAQPRVRAVCALALGECADSRIVPALAQIALQCPADRWTRAAVLSSASGKAGPLLKAVLHKLQPASAPEAFATLLEEISRLAVLEKAAETGEAAAIARSKASQESFSWRTGILLGLGKPPTEKLLELAALIAPDNSAPPAKRLLAVRLLASVLANPPFAEPARRMLVEIARSPAGADVQTAAIRGLADGGCAADLLAPEFFPKASPSAQEAVLSACFSRREMLPAVVDSLRRGIIAPGSLTPARRKMLQEHPDKDLRQQVAELVGGGGAADRMKVYEIVKAQVMPLAGRAGKGKEVFLARCAICHRLEREGFAVGPDLFDIRNQPREAILLHIIVPDREILPAFATCVAESKSGRVLAGILAGETQTAITLRMAAGVQETILRSDLKSLATSPQSLMPTELERTMTRQDLADLLAHLRGE
jgi:putative membrane-bound dehydrogenase-like protein